MSFIAATLVVRMWLSTHRVAAQVAHEPSVEPVHHLVDLRDQPLFLVSRFGKSVYIPRQMLPGRR
jgi:hypothetical protein